MRRTAACFGLLGLCAMLACACGAVSQPAAAKTIQVGQAQAGQTVQARVGDTVRISLTDDFPVPGSSLVWDASSSAPSVLILSSASAPQAQPGLGRVPYTADFLAQAAGEALLKAHGTTSCEAMPKASCPDQQFTITVVVSG